MWESGRVPGTVLLALTWALQPGVTPRPIERGVSYTASRGPSRSSRFERGVGCASSTRPGPKAATGSSLPWAVSSPAGICDTTHQTEQIPPNQWRNASLHQYSAGGTPPPSPVPRPPSLADRRRGPAPAPAIGSTAAPPFATTLASSPTPTSSLTSPRRGRAVSFRCSKWHVQQQRLQQAGGPACGLPPARSRGGGRAVAASCHLLPPSVSECAILGPTATSSSQRSLPRRAASAREVWYSATSVSMHPTPATAAQPRASTDRRNSLGMLCPVGAARYIFPERAASAMPFRVSDSRRPLSSGGEPLHWSRWGRGPACALASSPAVRVSLRGAFALHQPQRDLTAGTSAAGSVGNRAPCSAAPSRRSRAGCYPSPSRACTRTRPCSRRAGAPWAARSPGPRCWCSPGPATPARAAGVARTRI